VLFEEINLLTTFEALSVIFKVNHTLLLVRGVQSYHRFGWSMHHQRLLGTLCLLNTLSDLILPLFEGLWNVWGFYLILQNFVELLEGFKRGRNLIFHIH
jgi:hypothetical protein